MERPNDYAIQVSGNLTIENKIVKMSLYDVEKKEVMGEIYVDVQSYTKSILEKEEFKKQVKEINQILSDYIQMGNNEEVLEGWNNLKDFLKENNTLTD